MALLDISTREVNILNDNNEDINKEVEKRKRLLYIAKLYIATVV